MSKEKQASSLNRRELLAGAGALASATAGLVFRRAWASTEADMEAVRRLLGGGTPSRSSRIRLDMPRAFASGHTVPLALEVESPMTEDNHVRRVHVLTPGNPFFETATFHFTPRNGKASVSTRVRLEAGDQPVLAVAEMSDGAVLMTRTNVEVAVGGCGN